MEGGAATTLFWGLMGRQRAGVLVAWSPPLSQARRCGRDEGLQLEYTGNYANLYPRGDRVSVICEAVTAGTTARRHGQHRARCVLSAGLCGALWSHRDAVPSCGGTPSSFAPLGIAYRDGCYAFVCHR